MSSPTENPSFKIHREGLSLLGSNSVWNVDIKCKLPMTEFDEKSIILSQLSQCTSFFNNFSVALKLRLLSQIIVVLNWRYQGTDTA